MQFFATLWGRRPANRPSSATQTEDIVPIETDKADPKAARRWRKAHQEKDAAKIVSNYYKDAWPGSRLQTAISTPS